MDNNHSAMHLASWQVRFNVVWSARKKNEAERVEKTMAMTLEELYSATGIYLETSGVGRVVGNGLGHGILKRDKSRIGNVNRGRSGIVEVTIEDRTFTNLAFALSKTRELYGIGLARMPSHKDIVWLLQP